MDNLETDFSITRLARIGGVPALNWKADLSVQLFVSKDHS